MTPEQLAAANIVNTLGDSLLSRILFIGEEIPETLMKDERSKFILLGNPAELMDEVRDSIGGSNA